MAKNGTTEGRAAQYRAQSTSGVRHGTSQKHVVTGGKPTTQKAMCPGNLTSPIKGPDRGGVC